ncbi:MAG: hypothetical protein KKA73_22700 [Chloroflexi bacterium]|nr:hypothetical protein [Chloroflexota bacterium]MBU1750502.1 hypothetical protein [Chloroflexota bacterium]
MNMKIKYLVPVMGALLIVGTVLLPGVTAQPNLERGGQAPSDSKGSLGPSSTLFSYQGQLLDANSDPVNGNVEMTFHLHHEATDGTAFWTEAYIGTQAITVTNGLFHVLLGSLAPINPADLTGDVYLELVVGGETLAPRELLTSVAFAVEAKALDGEQADQFVHISGDSMTGNLFLGANNIEQIGQLWFGAGHDTNLYCSTATVLASDGTFLSRRDSSSLEAFATLVEGDTITRWKVKADGKMYWGPGGSAGHDTVLYRGGANLLKTDDSLAVVGDLTAGGKLSLGTALYSSGTPSSKPIISTNGPALEIRPPQDSVANNGVKFYDGNTSNHIRFTVGGDARIDAINDSGSGLGLYLQPTGGGTTVGGNLTVSGNIDATDGYVSNVTRLRSDNEYIDFYKTSSGGAEGARVGKLGVDNSYANADAKLDSLGGNSLWVNDKIQAGGEIKSDSNLSVLGTASIGQAGVSEGGEITLQRGSSGSYWTLDNYFGDFRLHHDDKVYLTVKKSTGPGLEIWPGYKDNQPNSEWVTLDMPGTKNLRVWDNFSVHGDMELDGYCIGGAYIEANLQTQKEQEAGRIDRFEEGDVLCWSPETARLEKCTIANDPLVQAIADPQGRPIVLGAEVVKVIGPVRVGDYLVASDVPGYAMAAPHPTFGVVIAQALEDLVGDRGLVKAMIRKM